MTTEITIIQILFGIIALGIGAELIVRGATSLAKTYKVSGYFIGFTIVAFGTSIPELSATITAISYPEINSVGLALGNIIGSNMFNMLAVLTIPVLITPIDLLDPDVIKRDFAFMFFLTLLFASFLFYFSKNKLTRREGIILLLFFVGYQFYIYRSTVGA